MHTDVLCVNTSALSYQKLRRVPSKGMGKHSLHIMSTLNHRIHPEMVQASPGGWQLVIQCGKGAQGWQSSCSVTKRDVTGTVKSAPALLTERWITSSREILPSLTDSHIKPLGSYLSQILHFSVMDGVRERQKYNLLV